MDLDEDDVIAGLFKRVAAAQGEQNAFFSYDQCRRWNPGILEALRQAGLLHPADEAISIVCQKCDHRCHRPVRRRRRVASLETYIECQERNDVTIVPVPSERLQRWKTSQRSVAAFVAQELCVRIRDPDYKAGRIVFGTRRFGRRRMPFSLEFQHGQSLFRLGPDERRPLEDLIIWLDGRPRLDNEEINYWAETVTSQQNRHQPSNLKRAQQKERRSARDEEWQRQADVLKARYPSKSKEDVAEEIFTSRRWPGVSSPKTIERVIRVSKSAGAKKSPFRL